MTDQTTIRGQSPGTLETPPIMAPTDAATNPYTAYSAAPYGVTAQNPEPYGDPFNYGPDPVLGGYGQQPTILSGVNGPQPYRFGFTPKLDYAYLADAKTANPSAGRFQAHELDLALAYTSTPGGGWVVTSTPHGGMRFWNGPDTIALPEQVFRAGWSITLASPNVGPWGMQLEFDPSINSDFEDSIGREALNLDGNGMVFYRASPQLMFVLGAGYWDRVDGIVVPYAGVVWNPNQFWELRLMSPKSRISYFLGTINGGAHWLYVQGEYHVESYQIHSPAVTGREQIQLSDWRVGLGLRSEHGWYDKFFEVGYVFGRKAEFLKGTANNFDINDGFMARFGIRF